MSTPTQKHTKSQKRVRRGALALFKSPKVVCPKCKKPVRPHKACDHCGTYKGRQIFKVRVPKKFRKKKEKEEKKK